MKYIKTLFLIALLGCAAFTQYTEEEPTLSEPEPESYHPENSNEPEPSWEPSQEPEPTDFASWEGSDRPEPSWEQSAGENQSEGYSVDRYGSEEQEQSGPEPDYYSERTPEFSEQEP